MKKEQRQVLDELEKQLSSLISEKEKLEERQVTLVPNKLKQSKGKKFSFVIHSVSFPPNYVKSCRKIVKASYNKFKFQH